MIQAVYLEIAPGRLAELSEFIRGLRAGAPVPVVVLVRHPPEHIQRFVAELMGKSKLPLETPNPGDELVSGQVYLIGASSDDLVVERKISRSVVFKRVPRAEGAGAGPSSVVLVESLARAYGAGLAAIASGVDAPDTLEALVLAQQAKALALVEENSATLLEMAFRRFPAGGFPDDIPSMQQIQNLVNG